MLTNCTLYYKIVKTRNKTYRVQFTFDSCNRITLKNTALLTGDIANTTDDPMYVQSQIDRAIAQAKSQLSTSTVMPY